VADATTTYSGLDPCFLFCIATKADVEKHFESHGTGTINEIKLMNGFGFIEYDDPQDAMDVVPGEQHLLALQGISV
jgi:RNA recognition motif-containing protein